MKAFVSYSWDSASHRDWVNNLVATLRSTYGIDASFDGMLLRTNLNRMMVEQIQNADKIIIVLTKEYAKKAEAFHGGVGTETQLLLNYIMKRPEKLIFIKREETDIPLCFEGFEYIDFKNGISNNNMEQLVLKINELPEYETVPITKTPKIIKGKKTSEEEDLIPILHKPTIDDENAFLLNELEKADKKIVSLLEETKRKNPGFDFTRTFRIESEQTGLSIDRNGSLKEQHTHYYVYTYTAFYEEHTSCFRIWHSQDSIMSGIFGTSSNNTFASNRYNSYELGVSAERTGRELSLKNLFGVYNEEICTGTDLGVCVFKRIMSRIPE